MRLGSRLLFPLIPIVVVIMVAYAAWSLIEREESLVPAARQEVQAYSNALGLAFDQALRDLRREDLQALANQVTRTPSIYGILLYDSTGAGTVASEPLSFSSAAPASALQMVLRDGRSITLEREIEGQRVFSVLRPLRRANGTITGILEVAEPLSFVEEAKAHVRRRFLLNTLTLLLALTVVTLWLVGRVVTRPMEQLVAAAHALGEGRLAYRIPEDPGGGELAELAREFNQMAGNLERTRAEVVREAEGRVVAERRLREAEKAAAIGNLAAGLAHEIAAPLTVISGRAELLLRTDPDPAARTRNLEIINRQINRITAIVRNLLDFAKRKEPRLRTIDLSEVVGSVLEFLDAEIGRAGIVVERDIPGPTPIQGDADLLHQVFANLVMNAIQAMDTTEGHRTLTIRIHPATAESVAVEVGDTGPGIPDEVLTQIFQPFFTTKPRGTGLGLVLARRIVEEHGGRLEVESEPTGSVFRVLLPNLSPRPATATHG